MSMKDYSYIDPGAVEFVAISNIEDLPVGERLFVEIDDLDIVVFNLAGEVYAIGDICSHDDGPLGEGEIEDREVICPRHGARFDVRTGKAVGLPAVIDIPAYPVKLEDGQLWIGIPKEE